MYLLLAHGLCRPGAHVLAPRGRARREGRRHQQEPGAGALQGEIEWPELEPESSPGSGPAVPPRPAAAGRHPRHRPHPRARGAVLRHGAGRHGRGGHQDRGARQGRRHAGLAALRGRRGHLLHGGQPQQEEPHPQPQGAGRAGHPARPHRAGRRGARELPPGHDGAPRLRLRGPPQDEPAAHLLLDLRLRRERPGGARGRATTSSCRASRA